MILLVCVIVATHAAGHRVTESIEDVPPEAFFNTTTLYPVTNKTIVEVKTNSSKPENHKIKSEETAWKIETALAETSIDEEKKPTAAPKVNKTNNAEKEFKPSPHLGSFFDIESIPTGPTFDDFRPLKKPPKGFLSSQKDQFGAGLFNKDVNQHNVFPYKFEGSLHPRAKDNWRPTGLETKPTMQVPVMMVPAGGFYKSPEAFKETDNGLDFDDLKDNNLDVKKRVNPWKNLLHLMTAFIPVGLIISALTPNVITVHSTGPDNQYPPQYRKSDPGIADFSPISEPCRRRLLCELHSENYNTLLSGSSPRRKRPCHRLKCEDPETVSRMLQWLATHSAGDKSSGLHFT